MKKNKHLNVVNSINMTVNDDQGLLSPYCESGMPVISSDVADFLLNGANAFHPAEKLVLNVTSDCVDKNEQKQYASAIKNYFALKLNDVQRDLKRKTLIAVWFTIIGIVALAFMFICDAYNVANLWIECIDIFAWVFLWEAVDQFFIERSELLLLRKRYINLIQMPINFIAKTTR